MKRIFCMQVLLRLYVCGLAQPIPPVQQGIRIGETMPDVMLSNIYNYSFSKGKFSALQRELTIIDFWTTSCGACVGSFDKVQLMQNKYRDRLQVLMMNASLKEDAVKLNSFFKKRKQRTGKDFTLAYAIQDTTLRSLFPFTTIPHCVWIDRNRKVIAITGTEAVTAANIEAVLSGALTSLPFKDDDLLFDADKDELLPADSNKAHVLLTQSFITSEQAGLGVKFAYQAVNGTEVKKMLIVNYTLLGLYWIASGDAFRLSNGRVLIDSSVQQFFREDLGINDRPKYCYELNTRPIIRKEATKWLRADLERYFRVRAVAAQQWMPVFVLKPGNKMGTLLTKNGQPETDLDSESLHPFIRNGSMDELRYFLEVILGKPVVDETGITQSIDISFPKEVRDFNPAQVSLFLKEKGIGLQEGERLMPVTRLVPINN